LYKNAAINEDGVFSSLILAVERCHDRTDCNSEEIIETVFEFYDFAIQIGSKKYNERSIEQPIKENYLSLQMPVSLR
jgi:hypothetical protein